MPSPEILERDSGTATVWRRSRCKSCEKVVAYPQRNVCPASAATNRAGTTLRCPRNG